MLNKKGITLVEIVISIALISVVLMFLFSLLIQINNENNDNELRSSYLIMQSSLINQIEEDFLDYNFQAGNKCDNASVHGNIVEVHNAEGNTDATNIYIQNWNNNPSQFKCLTFKYASGFAHLFLYKRNDDKTVVAYYRDDFKQTEVLEDFNWEENNFDAKYNYSNNEYTFSLPIIGPDYNDYSINLSY